MTTLHYKHAILDLLEEYKEEGRENAIEFAQHHLAGWTDSECFMLIMNLAEVYEREWLEVDEQNEGYSLWDTKHLAIEFVAEILRSLSD